MGLFSTAVSIVGSAVSGVVGAVCSGVSKVCGAIGGALRLASKAVTGIAEVIGGLAPVLYPKLELPKVFEIFVAIVNDIAEVLGIKETEKDDAEELALKAESADKKPEDFDSTEAYIQYLHEKVELDKEKMQNLTPEEKASYGVVGSYLYLKAAAEKLEVDEINAPFIMSVAKLGLSPEAAVNVIKNLKASGIRSTDAVEDYLCGQSESLKTADAVDNALVSGMKESNPEMTEDDIYDSIIQLEKDLKG